MHLRVRRWHGLRPIVVAVAITIAPEAMDREWRRAVSATTRKLLRGVRPIRWPSKPAGLAGWQKPPWVEVHALAPPTAWKRVLALLWRRIRSLGPLEDCAVDDAAAAAELEEKLAAALTGLVPKPRPDATRSQLVVEYGETTRDQSPTWRARVVDQVSARLGIILPRQLGPAEP